MGHIYISGISVASVALATALTTMACAAPAPVPASAPVMSAEQQIGEANALDQRFVEAFNKGDAAAMNELYWNSPEVVSTQLDVFEPVAGIDSVREVNLKALAGMAGAKLEITRSRQVPAGEVVMGWGTAKITLPGTPPTELMVRFTDVKGQRDGKWVYLMDHVSMPPPTAK